MRNQFITNLTSDAFRVKLIGKGRRHKTTQEKVKLREGIEAAKTFEAAAFAKQLMKTTRNRSAGASQLYKEIAAVITVFLV